MHSYNWKTNLVYYYQKVFAKKCFIQTLSRNSFKIGCKDTVANATPMTKQEIEIYIEELQAKYSEMI